MNNSTPIKLPNHEDIFIDPVSDQLKHMFELINYVILCGIISLFGIVTNTINIIVFVRQGFKDSINISLLGLALGDLGSSMTMFWMSVCHNLFFQNIALPFDPLDVMYATAGLPNVCFNRITTFITAFITLERCLCIAMPLKVRSIITPFRTKIINIANFICMFILFSPFYFVNTLEWKYNFSQNRSIIAFAYGEDKGIVESVTYFIHSVFLPSAFLLSVTVCTIILVVKLNEKSKWRKSAAKQTSSTTESTSVKEKKVVKMVTLISAIYIACYMPPTINFLAMVFYPDYNYGEKLYNLLVATWSVAFVLVGINSGVNMFVYFAMSTKFNEALRQLLGFPKLQHT